MANTAETLVNGYHKFSLCLGREPEESISFSEFNADFGDGFESSTLFGSILGTKKWNIKFNVLAQTSDNTYTLDGINYSAADYVWELFMRQKRTGAPFVVVSPRNNQNYLAKFADSNLSYQRGLVKLYNTGFQIKQIRKPGVSVFDPTKLNLWARWTAESVAADDGDILADTSLNDQTANNRDLYIPTGADARFKTNIQNGLPVIRLNSIDDTGYMYLDEPILAKRIFFVMKMREETFSSNCGILCGEAGDDPAITGHSGQTKFFDYNYDSAQKFVYEKDSVEFPESNMQAPMSNFSLVKIRAQSGIPLDRVQIGKDRAATDRFAKMDLCEVALDNGGVADSDALEYEEYLMNHWALPSEIEE